MILFSRENCKFYKGLSFWYISIANPTANGYNPRDFSNHLPIRDLGEARCRNSEFGPRGMPKHFRSRSLAGAIKAIQRHFRRVS